MAEQTIAPAEADKAIPPAEVQGAGQPPQPVNKEEVLTPEMREELRRNLNASKEEGLRLKGIVESERAKREELEAKLAQLTPKTQDESYQFSDSDIEAFDKFMAARDAKREEALRREQEAIDAQRSQIQAEYGTQQKIAVDMWLAVHPEYNKVGDPDSDKAWSAIEDKVKNLPPPLNASDWGKVLDLAQKDRKSVV